MKKRILVFGEICRELALNCSGSFSDEIIHADGFENSPGGYATNVAAALAWFGNEAILCSSVGNDPDGKLLLKWLEGMTFDKGKLDRRFVKIKSDISTPLHVNLNTVGGKKSVICHSVDYGVNKEDVEDAFITYPDIAVILDSVTSGGYAEIKKQAAKRNCEVFVMNCETSERLASVGGCKILSLTDAQTEKIVSTKLGDQQSCMRACMSLAKLAKAEFIILRLSGGYFIYDGTFYTFIPAYDIGDREITESDPIFCAAFVQAYLDSEGDIRYSCEYANATVAVYVTRGKTELPTVEQVKRFAERNGTKL